MDPQRLWMMLNDLAARMGVEVRLERMEDGEGFVVQGGLCRIGESLVAIVDRRQGPSGRTVQLARALAGLELDGVSMVPMLREMLEKAKEQSADEE